MSASDETEQNSVYPVFGECLLVGSAFFLTIYIGKNDASDH